MKKKKRKKYIEVVTIHGSRNTKMNFGIIENPTFKNDIFINIKSAHKSGDGLWELRTDEALLYIQALSACLRRKITGVNLVLLENN